MKKHFFILAIIYILISANNAISGCWKVTDKMGNVTVVSDLWNFKSGEGDNKISMIRGYVNSAYTEIPLEKIQSIIITKAGEKSYIGIGKIILKSGTSGAFKGKWRIHMISEFGESETQYGYIKSITLCDEGALTSKKSSIIATSKFDTIIMKNGDILNGEIVTEQFILKTSYAKLTIAKDDIESINLEGSGQNIETVQLKTGDRISGMIENKTLEIKLPIGSQVTLEKDKIKLINFKKNK